MTIRENNKMLSINGQLELPRLTLSRLSKVRPILPNSAASSVPRVTQWGCFEPPKKYLHYSSEDSQILAIRQNRKQRRKYNYPKPKFSILSSPGHLMDDLIPPSHHSCKLNISQKSNLDRKPHKQKQPIDAKTPKTFTKFKAIKPKVPPMSASYSLSVSHIFKSGNTFSWSNDQSIRKLKNKDTPSIIKSSKTKKKTSLIKQLLALKAQSLHAKVFHIDEFIALAPLGKGSTSNEVLLVRKKTTNQLFAAKIIYHNNIRNANMSGKIVFKQISAEINSMNKICHHHACKLYDVIHTQQETILIMDYIPGGNLRFFLNKQEKRSENEIRFYTAEILVFIEYIHSIGILFRDIKLDNIILDGDGHIVFTDFGMSDPNFNGVSNELMGSPGVIAPEVIKGNEYGKPVDYWGLGCVLYNMLTGHLPFEAKNIEDLCSLILNHPPIEIQLRANNNTHDVSASAIDLVSKLLDKNPETRIDGTGVRYHPFFASVDWEMAGSRGLRAPIVPKISQHITDINTSLSPENMKISTASDSLDMISLENVDQSAKLSRSRSDIPSSNSSSSLASSRRLINHSNEFKCDSMYKFDANHPHQPDFNSKRSLYLDWDNNVFTDLKIPPVLPQFRALRDGEDRPLPPSREALLLQQHSKRYHRKFNQRKKKNLDSAYSTWNPHHRSPGHDIIRSRAERMQKMNQLNKINLKKKNEKKSVDSHINSLKTIKKSKKKSKKCKPYYERNPILQPLSAVPIFLTKGVFDSTIEFVTDATNLGIRINSKGKMEKRPLQKPVILEIDVDKDSVLDELARNLITMKKDSSIKPQTKSKI